MITKEMSKLNGQETELRKSTKSAKQAKEGFITATEAAQVTPRKYLTQVIKEDKPVFTNNTMIISPVGSGKTTFMKHMAEELTKDSKKKLVFLLVSNTFLSKSLAPDDIELRKRLANRCVASNESVEVYGPGRVVIRVMTYAKFGREIAKGHEYAKKAAAIFCDEIHSLVDYHSYNRSELLAHAIPYLFNEHEGQRIFYFTATAEKLNKFNKSDRVYKSITKNIKIIDYTNYSGIVKLEEEKVTKVSDLFEISEVIESIKEDFIGSGKKGLAYCKRITEMKSMKDMLIQKGFNPICLWSQNNEEQPMDEEQLRVLNEIIRTNKIPAPYDFLIINSAMREGWDLKDESVELAIINTIDKTDQIQARGRIRKNIKHLIIKAADTDERYVAKVIVPNEYLNKILVNDEKEDLCAMLNKIDSRGRRCGWIAIKKMLEDSGYILTDKRVRVEGKQTRVSIITLKIEEAEEAFKSTETTEKAKKTKIKKVDNKTREVETEDNEKVINIAEKNKKTKMRYEDIAEVVHDKDGEIVPIKDKDVELLTEQARLEDKCARMQLEMERVRLKLEKLKTLDEGKHK